MDPINAATLKYRVGFQYVGFWAATNEVGGLGAWHHYAFSYNYSTQNVAGWADGVKVISATSNRWLNENGELLMTLASNGSATNANNLDGKMANANLYLRALTDADVAALAAGINVIPSDADHQWIFANDDFTDTGTASTKWNLQIQSSTGSGTGNITFEDVA